MEYPGSHCGCKNSAALDFKFFALSKKDHRFPMKEIGLSYPSISPAL